MIVIIKVVSLPRILFLITWASIQPWFRISRVALIKIHNKALNSLKDIDKRYRFHVSAFGLPVHVPKSWVDKKFVKLIKYSSDVIYWFIAEIKFDGESNLSQEVFLEWKAAIAKFNFFLIDFSCTREQHEGD